MEYLEDEPFQHPQGVVFSKKETGKKGQPYKTEKIEERVKIVLQVGLSHCIKSYVALFILFMALFLFIRLLIHRSVVAWPVERNKHTQQRRQPCALNFGTFPRTR